MELKDLKELKEIPERRPHHRSSVERRGHSRSKTFDMVDRKGLIRGISAPVDGDRERGTSTASLNPIGRNTVGHFRRHTTTRASPRMNARQISESIPNVPNLGRSRSSTVAEKIDAIKSRILRNARGLRGVRVNSRTTKGLNNAFIDYIASNPETGTARMKKTSRSKPSLPNFVNPTLEQIVRRNSKHHASARSMLEGRDSINPASLKARSYQAGARSSAKSVYAPTSPSKTRALSLLPKPPTVLTPNDSLQPPINKFKSPRSKSSSMRDHKERDDVNLDETVDARTDIITPGTGIDIASLKSEDLKEDLKDVKQRSSMSKMKLLEDGVARSDGAIINESKLFASIVEKIVSKALDEVENREVVRNFIKDTKSPDEPDAESEEKLITPRKGPPHEAHFADIMKAMRKAPSKRDGHDIESIKSYLDSFSFFQEYLQNNMEITNSSNFCRHVFHLSLPEGTKLNLAEEKEKRLFIIIAGRVKLSVTPRQSENSPIVPETRIIVKGGNFGEQTFVPSLKKDILIAESLEPCEFLVLKEDGFYSVYGSTQADYDDLDDHPESFIPLARHFRLDQNGKPRSRESRIDLATRYIWYAQGSKSVKRHRFRPPYVNEIDWLLNSDIYETIFIILVFGHLAITILEPPSRHQADNRKFAVSKNIALGFEWLIISFYSISYGLELYNKGRYFWDKLRICWTFVMFLFILDLLMATASGSAFFRFSRFFRPFMLLLRMPLLRVAYMISLQTLVKLTHIWIILGIIFVIFACIGLYLFNFNKDIYNEHAFIAGDGFPECGGPCVDDLPYWVWRSFSSFEETLIALFVLLTTENYPEVSIPAYMAEHLYQTYFILFWLLGEAFLLQLLIAFIFDVYKGLMENWALQQMWNERFALHCAFECLDLSRDGKISHKAFIQLLEKLKPEWNQMQRETLFKLMDSNGNRLLEEAEFLDLCDFIKVDIKELEEDFIVGASATLNLKPTSTYSGSFNLFCCPEYGSLLIFEFFKGNIHFYIVNLLIILDSFILVAYAFNPENAGVTNVLQVIMWSIIALDHVLSIYCLGLPYLALKWTLVDILIDLITFGGIISLFTTNRLFGFLRFFGLFRTLRLARLFEVWIQSTKEKARIREQTKEFEVDVMKLDKTEKEKKQIIDLKREQLTLQAARKETITILDTMINMIPWFIFMCIAMVCVLMYTYAIIGIEAFPSDNPSCNGVTWINYRPRSRFCDFQAGLLTLLQIVTTSNWHEIMYGAMDETGSTVVSLYFISFYFLAVIMMFNIIVAVFIEIFQTIHSSQELAEDHKGEYLDDLLRRQEEENEGDAWNGSEGDEKDPDIHPHGVSETKRNRSVAITNTKSSRIIVKKKVGVFEFGKKAFVGKGGMENRPTSFSPEDQKLFRKITSPKADKRRKSWAEREINSEIKRQMSKGSIVSSKTSSSPRVTGARSSTRFTRKASVQSKVAHIRSSTAEAVSVGDITSGKNLLGSEISRVISEEGSSGTRRQRDKPLTESK
mmetsp:Transcript_2466/g.3547  ORF Transcript_2466/g.3547 Transcript_2466/m.3547 type:complete len:1495 (+) Transcript_2466:43-4527(+)